MAGVLFSNAGFGQCRWITCEATEPPTRQRDIFRGRRVCAAPVVYPGSYCAEHRLRVYQPAGRLVPPRETSVRAAPPAEQPRDLTEIFG